MSSGSYDYSVAVASELVLSGTFVCQQKCNYNCGHYICKTSSQSTDHFFPSEGNIDSLKIVFVKSTGTLGLQHYSAKRLTKIYRYIISHNTAIGNRYYRIDIAYSTYLLSSCLAFTHTCRWQLNKWRWHVIKFYLVWFIPVVLLTGYAKA